MKTYALLPIFASASSTLVGAHQGYCGEFVENQFLGVMVASSLVVGGSIVSYFHAHPRDVPVSWESDFMSHARFGTIVGGVVSAGAFGLGYVLGRGCALGLEQLL